MCGATASNDMGNYGNNVFVLYEIGDEAVQRIKLVKVYSKINRLSFEEENII
jgi:hypothetical protein